MKQKCASYLLFALAFAGPAVSATPALQDEPLQLQQADATAAPIRTERELAEFLRNTRSGQSPLDALSPGARERFLSSLHFNENGLTGFDLRERAMELSASQIRRVLALFGSEALTEMVDSMANPGPTHNSETTTSPIERKYTVLYVLEGELERNPSITEQEQSRRLAAEYQRLFAGLTAPAALQEASSRDLDFLHRATHLVAFYTAQPRYAVDLVRILEVLQARGAATDSMHADTLRMLAQAREFGRASELVDVATFPEAVQLPRVEDRAEAGEGPTVLTFERDSWMRRPVTWDRADRIVVVSHPNCHFTQDAIAAIEADPELSSLLADSIWLAPQDGTVDFGIYREWNRAHPQSPMVVAYMAGEFPLIDDWVTPIFYFIKDGRPVAKVVGWPDEGKKAELMAAARKLDSPAP